MSDPVGDLRRELVAAAERRHVLVAEGADRTGLSAPRVRWLLASVALVVVATAALFITSPWQSSPSFLEKAEAALAPRAGMILHQKWEITFASADLACTVRHHPNEIWVDETPPYRFRAYLDDLESVPLGTPRRVLCSKPATAEFGGTLKPGHTLQFVPPNTLRGSLPVQFGTQHDPVRQIREAIATGEAHDEGKVTLDGRTVERIRLDDFSVCPGAAGCSHHPAYAYVDPETFQPVQLVSMDNHVFDGDFSFDFVMRTLTFDYLPRTDSNLALTDIRKQHPNATEG